MCRRPSSFQQPVGEAHYRIAFLFFVPLCGSFPPKCALRKWFKLGVHSKGPPFFCFWLLERLRRRALSKWGKRLQHLSNNLTDSRHLNEIFFDTLQMFRFCVHDSLKPYAIRRESDDTKLDSRISFRMSL